MLTEICIEALLVDEELADQVWETWDKGEIDDQVAWFSWWLLKNRSRLGHKHGLVLGNLTGLIDSDYQG